MWVEQSHQEKYKSKHIVYNKIAASNFFIKKTTPNFTWRMNKEHKAISIGTDISQRLSSQTGVIQENLSFRDFRQQSSQGFRSLHRISLKFS